MTIEVRGTRRERLLRAAGIARPRPPIGLTVGRTASAGAGRVVTAALMLIATAAAAISPIIWLGAAILIALSLLRPRGPWTPIFLLLIGVGLLQAPADPIRTAIALLAGHLTLLLSNALGSLPWSGRIELLTLRRPLLRFAVIQPVAQGLALLSFAIAAEGVVLPIAAALAAIALAVVVWRVVVRLRRRF